MNSWTLANHRLIAKAIGELHFEEVLAPVRCGDAWKIELKSGVTYKFHARMGAWNHLWVSPEGLSRRSTEGMEIELSAGQFFIDSLHETGMSELTLGTFLEEMNNTLYADMEAPSCARVDEMRAWDELTLQQNLKGHPKLLLNKGRMGWGASDLARYAPEKNARFQLHWILASQESLVGAQASDWTIDDVLEQSFVGEEKAKMLKTLKSYPRHSLLPVHPWQWDNVIKIQFAGEIARGHIISIGTGGDEYGAQTSVRTLSNVSRPEKMDIKLPLSILNTSCVRGLPHRYLKITPALSHELVKLCQQDPILKDVDVLLEKSAWGYVHPEFHRVQNAPYRYHEQLGAVWRENAQSKSAFLAAALFHQDEQGKTLLEAYAKQANVSIESWLKVYTQKIIIPLYHLQLAYGVGVVAHGQNVVVRLKDGVPAGLVLKDFHGDLRLSNKHVLLHQKHFAGLSDQLTHLPPEHLIHDLVTGHFITTLRFLARALEDSGVLKEKDCFKAIAQELHTYQQLHAKLITPETDVLAATFAKVLVNRVRFKIGYGDSSERPLPILGQALTNPLHRELHS